MIELNNKDAIAYIEYLKATGNIEKLSSLCQALTNEMEVNSTMKQTPGKTTKGLRSPLGASWLEKGMPKGSKWQDEVTKVVVEIADHTVFKGGVKFVSFGDKYFAPDVKEKIRGITSFSGVENYGSKTHKNSFTAKNWVCVEEGMPPYGCKTGHIAKKGDTIRSICRDNGFKIA